MGGAGEAFDESNARLHKKQVSRARFGAEATLSRGSTLELEHASGVAFSAASRTIYRRMEEVAKITKRRR